VNGEFSPEESYVICKDRDRDEWKLFQEQQKSITDGERYKELFDCKRALWGYLGQDADPAQIHVDKVRPNTVGDLVVYRVVCQKVTHETPYQSQ
jgi:hypothetical protein